jgi:hypothetical protein
MAGGEPSRDGGAEKAGAATDLKNAIRRQKLQAIDDSAALRCIRGTPSYTTTLSRFAARVMPV